MNCFRSTIIINDLFVVFFPQISNTAMNKATIHEFPLTFQMERINQINSGKLLISENSSKNLRNISLSLRDRSSI